MKADESSKEWAQRVVAAAAEVMDGNFLDMSRCVECGSGKVRLSENKGTCLDCGSNYIFTFRTGWTRGRN